MMEGGEAMPDLARVSRLLADAYRLLSDQSLGNGELAVAMKLLTETEATEQTARPRRAAAALRWHHRQRAGTGVRAHHRRLETAATGEANGQGAAVTSDDLTRARALGACFG
jgi:hypothetical protein